jgi:hypothetical protein
MVSEIDGTGTAHLVATPDTAAEQGQTPLLWLHWEADAPESKIDAIPVPTAEQPLTALAGIAASESGVVNVAWLSVKSNGNSTETTLLANTLRKLISSQPSVLPRILV